MAEGSTGFLIRIPVRFSLSLCPLSPSFLHSPNCSPPPSLLSEPHDPQSPRPQGSLTPPPPSAPPPRAAFLAPPNPEFPAAPRVAGLQRAGPTCTAPACTTDGNRTQAAGCAAQIRMPKMHHNEISKQLGPEWKLSQRWRSGRSMPRPSGCGCCTRRSTWIINIGCGGKPRRS